MTATAAATTQVYRIYIKATPEAIWAAITEPEWTARYGYGGDADFDLRPGGEFKFHASPEFLAAGAPEIVVDGQVIEVDPPRRLVLDWRLPMDEGLKAEGFTRLTYDIEPVAEGKERIAGHR